MMLNLLGLLRNPIIAAIVTSLIALPVGFLRGHSAGSDAERVAHLEAQLEAEKDRARREAALAKRLANEKADLREALDTIDAEDPLTGDGADVVLGHSFLCQLQRTYNPDIGCDPALPGRRE